MPARDLSSGAPGADDSWNALAQQKRAFFEKRVGQDELAVLNLIANDDGSPFRARLVAYKRASRSAPALYSVLLARVGESLEAMPASNVVVGAHSNEHVAACMAAQLARQMEWLALHCLVHNDQNLRNVCFEHTDDGPRFELIDFGSMRTLKSAKAMNDHVGHALADDAKRLAAAFLKDLEKARKRTPPAPAEDPAPPSASPSPVPATVPTSSPEVDQQRVVIDLTTPSPPDSVGDPPAAEVPVPEAPPPLARGPPIKVDVSSVFDRARDLGYDVPRQHDCDNHSDECEQALELLVDSVSAVNPHATSIFMTLTDFLATRVDTLPPSVTAALVTGDVISNARERIDELVHDERTVTRKRFVRATAEIVEALIEFIHWR